MKSVYWISLGFILYAYFGYPLALVVIGLLRPKVVRKESVTPEVSFIITVHNEEKRVAEKIENTLAQRYPPAAMEVIVTSDCSTDRTDDIVKTFAPRGVRLVRAAERKGKENAQLHAIRASHGDVLVFSDVGTLLEPNGVATIVRSFADAGVGCVSSIDRVLDEHGAPSGEGMYVKYEMLLRKLETKAGSVVGLSGSFFAVRRSLCRDWSIDAQSDFRTLLNSVRSGLRGVSDDQSVGYYRSIADESKEFERKVRTVLRGIATLMKTREVLNPFRFGMFSWQVWSHKMCRWLVPFAMVSAFVSNAMLMGEPVYLVLFGLQLVFYAAALVGLTMSRLATSKFIRTPAFFVLANLSIAQAWYRYLCGERMVAWSPSRR